MSQPSNKVELQRLVAEMASAMLGAQHRTVAEEKQASC